MFKKIYKTLIITILIIVLLDIFKTNIGIDSISHLKLPNLFIYGFISFLILNCIFVSLSIIKGLHKTKDIQKEDELSEEEKEKRIEEVVVPALQGETNPPESILKYFKIFMHVCFGLMLGPI